MGSASALIWIIFIRPNWNLRLCISVIQTHEHQLWSESWALHQLYPESCSSALIRILGSASTLIWIMFISPNQNHGLSISSNLTYVHQDSSESWALHHFKSEYCSLALIRIMGSASAPIWIMFIGPNNNHGLCITSDLKHAHQPKSKS